MEKKSAKEKRRVQEGFRERPAKRLPRLRGRGTGFRRLPRWAFVLIVDAASGSRQLREGVVRQRMGLFFRLRDLINYIGSEL